MNQVPQKYQALAALQLVAGAVNLLLGWWISSAVVSTVFGFVTALCSFGICPFGFLCGMVPWLIVPVAMLELVLGVLMLAAPDAVKAVVSWVPFVQVPLFLIGDFVSPVVGLVSAFLTRDPEVAGYIEGM